jgi:hypothetical protein
MTVNGLPLDPAEMKALQFLDRHSGDWYCTHCWADALRTDARALYRLSVLMGTDRALLAGYEAKADGPCKTHAAIGSRAGGFKGRRCVRSLGKVSVQQRNDGAPEEVGR